MNIYKRGQAMVETAIVMPMVLFSLFLLFGVAKMAVVGERMEADARMGLEIFQGTQALTKYSIYTVYIANAGLGDIIDLSGCSAPPKLLDANVSISSIFGATIFNSELWSAVGEKTACQPGNQTILGVSNGAQVHDFMFDYTQVNIGGTVSLPLGAGSLFKATKGQFNLQSQSANGLAVPSLGETELCFHDIQNAVIPSLAPGDQTEPAPGFAGTNDMLADTPPTDMLPVQASGDCEAMVPKYGSLPYSVNPGQ